MTRYLPATKNAVGAIRVSSVKQGTDGDSPEAQKEQIEKFAASKGFIIKKFFVFLESASKEQQPMQEAVDYCKNPGNKVDHFIIKSIDRFTRGGSLPYDLLKTQLEGAKVRLIDIYGIIGSGQVNTLEHLDVEYGWSVYSPSKKSEILEAERSKDELRDIMTRMVGAEVRYTRLGYWMRRPPFGYVSERIETPHGKRTILLDHPEESRFVKEIFRLRTLEHYTDREIAYKLNEMGYQNRQKRSSIGESKKCKLTIGQLWRIVRNPIYAGVNNEKWTNGKPVRCAFDGLVSIELFNKANKGKRVVHERPDGRLEVRDVKEARYATEKGKRSADFPYKQFVVCPQCRKPLLGSYSRGKSGKRYGSYHCNKRGHYFRVRKEDLEEKVNQFFASVRLSPECIDKLEASAEASWQAIEARYEGRLDNLDSRISALKGETENAVQKLKMLNNESAIRHMEMELEKLEKETISLEAQRKDLEALKPENAEALCRKLKHVVKHLGEILQQQMNPVKKARFFNLLFDRPPTYEDLAGQTPSFSNLTDVNPLFLAKNYQKSSTW